MRARRLLLILACVTWARGAIGACPDFSVRSVYGAPTTPISVAVVDVDNDGRADLVTANQSSGDISVLLGSGDGTFAPAVQYRTSIGAVGLVTGDFDGDGRVDVAIAIQSTSASVMLLFGRGDGTFGAAKSYALHDAVTSIASADFDHDGHLDLVTTYSTNGGGGLSIHHGNGDGTFRMNVANYATGNFPVSPVTGDFDGDGRPDLAVANALSNSVSMLLGKGDGTFRDPVTFGISSSSSPPNPSALVVADFNGDGRDDLATANPGTNNVAILLGRGDGTFAAPVSLEVGSAPRALVSYDFNGDGVPDIAVTNAGATTVSVLIGRGDGAFAPQVTYEVGSKFSGSIAAGDFNGDGKRDLAIANYAFNRISILTADSGGTFEAAQSFPLRHDRIQNPAVVAAVDVNGDGAMDIVVGNGATASSPGSVAVLLGRGDGTFADAVNYASGATPAAICTGDFNGDGKPDLAIANLDPGTVWILLGRGDGKFSDPLPISLGSPAGSIISSDFNGDGKADLAVTNASSSAVSILFGNGDGSFKTAVSFPAGSAPSSVVAADVNRDGKMDLITANFLAGDITVLIGDGDGGFALPAHFPAWTYSGEPVVALSAVDMNSDSKMDLVVVADGGVSVLLGNGDGTFARPIAVGFGQNTAVAVTDLNGDGIPDVAITDWGAPSVATLFGRADGTLSPQKEWGIGSVLYPTSVAAADFDGDGRADLIVADQQTSNLSLLLNAGDCASITALSSSSGLSLGGQRVTLTGMNLNSAVRVTFGEVPAQIVANTPSAIEVRTPPHLAGAVDVVAWTAGGIVTVPNAFRYVSGRVRAVR